MLEHDIRKLQNDQELNRNFECYKNSIHIIVDNTKNKASFVLNGISLFYNKDDTTILNKDSKDWYYGIKNIDEKIDMHDFFLKKIRELLAEQRIQIFQESEKKITGDRIYDYIEKKDQKYSLFKEKIFKIIDPFGAYIEYKAEKQVKNFIKNSVLACEGIARFIKKIEKLIIYYNKISSKEKKSDKEKNKKLIYLMGQINIELNLLIKSENNMINIMKDIIAKRESKKIFKNHIFKPLIQFINTKCEQIDKKYFQNKL